MTAGSGSLVLRSPRSYWQVLDSGVVIQGVHGIWGVKPETGDR